ncbi:polymer-forming cytoskeletal protein [Microbacterium sulfonylureivorans]|uniref:polymer-forming cytoskeletal protein n=1 Tax=Microbacterium sulfonylureivorans TaxID=2486854 RepID=UPI000FDC82D7|nr:polymer-forming cytoskeletal protein [Microbacterium sulfonylureivorans]
MSVQPRIRRSLAVFLAAVILTFGTGAAAFGVTPAPSLDAASAADDREGPQFYTGALVDVTGVVDGDVYAAGQSVTISGDVTGDVIAAAQTITITGTVDGDVRLSGQDVSITGEVSRSGTVFAASLTVGDSGVVGDDLVAAAGSVSIGGEIGRDVIVSVGRLTIDGSVGGSLTYVSDDDARIAEGAVDGTVERIEPPQTPRVEVSPWAVLIGWFLGLFYALVALSLITLLTGLLFPRWLHRVTDHLVPSPWKALLVGFVGAIAVPVALLFLAVTIVGAPLALAGLLVWTLMVLATFVYSAYYIGRLLFRGNQHPVVRSLVGGVILIVALQIPWLNILVWLAMVFFGLGAQLLEIHRQRPWRLTPAPTTASPLSVSATTPPQPSAGVAPASPAPAPAPTPPQGPALP